MKGKIIFLLCLFLLFQLVPLTEGGFKNYEIKSFGGKIDVTGLSGEEIIRPDGDISINIPNENPNGEDHYSLINESVADDDSSYVITSTDFNWKRDIYSLENISSSTGVINRVEVYARAKTTGTDSDNDKIMLSLYIDDTLYENDSQDLSSSYDMYSDYWTENPDTGESWNWGEINDMGAGLRLKVGGTGGSYCTQLYVVINWTIPQQPSVTTNSSTGVGCDNVTLNGYVTNDGLQTCTVWFEWGKTISYGNKTSNQTKSSYEEFNTEITGLSANTLYHFRAVINNPHSTQYGSDKSFKTSIGISVYNATAIHTTTATMNGKVDCGSDYNCGFWIGNTTTNSLSFVKNVSCSGKYDEGETFSKSVSGLTPGEYYYVRAWAYDTNVFINSTYEDYFISRPNTITNFSSNDSSSSSVTLKWTSPSVLPGTNYTVYIRYGSTAPGGSIDTSWGTLGYNGTDTWKEITGLSGDTTYYFVAWTLINASGSPLLWQFSDGYATTSNSTTGGNYTIYVRYENESNGRNYPVNLSKYGPHRFIIHYSDETDQILFNNGNCHSDSDGDFTHNQSGYINISTNKSIQFIEFHWNDSLSRPYRCNRIIVLLTGQRNITFYIRTNLPVWGEYTEFMNESLVRYNYNFIDQTGLFTVENGAYATIFHYNSTGVKHIIHSEFFDTSFQVHPWLIYDKKYYVGTRCIQLNYERIGIAPAGDNTDPEIIIPYTSNISYFFFDIIDLSIGWYDIGFYVDYLDTTASSQWVNFSVYGYYNHTSIHYENITLTNIYNFTFDCNVSKPYLWSMVLELNGAGYQGVYTTGTETVPIIPGIEKITDITTIDEIFNIIFGDSPIVNSDDVAIYAPWTYIIIFGVCFMWLTSTSKMNANIGALGVGLILIAAGSIISGVQILYDWLPAETCNTPAILAIGLFVVVLSIIAAHGGIESR